jgi:transcriptional regulator with GAF, ATPase, and Fis domain
MMDFLKKLTVLQGSIEPKLFGAMENFSRRFGADFLWLIFSGEEGAATSLQNHCYGEADLAVNALESVRELASAQHEENAHHCSFVAPSCLPIYLQEKLGALALLKLPLQGEREATLALGFSQPITVLPDNALELGYELLSVYSQLILRHALPPELERQDFISRFAKMLVEVQDHKQLHYLMDSVLKPFVAYSDCAVFLLDGHRGLMENLFFDAEVHLPPFPFKASLAIATTPVDDVIDAAGFGDAIRLMPDFEQLIQSKQVKPYLQEGLHQQSGESILFNLYSGRDVIGNCIFLFPEDHQPAEHTRALLDVITDHISATVVKILALYKVKIQGEEREILQSLSTDITFNRDSNTLLKAINPKLKLLFAYSHQFVVAVNQDELTVTGMLDDADSVLRFHSSYREVISARLPISDPVFTKVLLSNDPIVFDLELLALRQQLPKYMIMNMEIGIKKIVMASLRVGSRIMGIWAVCLMENQTMTPYQLELMKGVSHQLSIAVENIRNAGSAHQKAIEKEFLSQVGSEITWIRKRKDMRRLLDSTLKNYLGFEDAVLVLKTESGRYQKFELRPDLNGGSADPVPCDCGEGVMLLDRLMNGNTVQRFELEDLHEANVPSCLEEEISTGIKRKVCLKLRKDKRDMGIVFLNFSRPYRPESEAMDIYPIISAHLSMALSNILDSEEILRREEERELLLSLITDISAIRNPQQLISAISNKLKDFLGFRHLAIGKLNDDGESVDVFLSDPDSSARFHPEYNQIAGSKLFVEDGVIDKVLAAKGPVSYNLKELASKIELPAYLRINMESGISHIIAMRFLREERPFGTLVFFFEQDPLMGHNKMSLISGLGNQIAIAVSNIIANQELERRTQLETRMVDLGYELRSVKDLEVLWKLLGTRLQEFFRIGQFMVTVFHEDHKRHKAIFCTEKSIFAAHNGFTALRTDFQTLQTGTFSIILNSDKPVLFEYQQHEDSFDKLGCLEVGPLPAQSGTVGLVMKVGQQPMGFLLFEHADLNWLCRRKQLFESIISQAAIVISNILSNQRISLQLKEINVFKQQLEQEKIYLTEEIDKIHNYNEIIGESDALREVFKLVSRVSASDSTVLVLGETGTGKELIARAIHNNSPRKDRPMVKVNCAALPANLIESELFGHEKGSFTGATERRLGKFELANKGTLFLDEIGEMPIDLQVKLLRALQEKEIERVGGKETIKVDVRIIAATNRNLEKEISEGRFRSDLFYRLNIFPISLPALRERKQDIETLALHFVKHFNKNCGRNITSISTKAIEGLLSYDWPGNIRELEHLIERSVLLNKGTVLNEILLPTPMEQLVVKAQFEEFTLRTIDENEKDYILKVLRYCRGRIAGQGGAAQILGVPPTTLNSKIKRLGIKREHTSPAFHENMGAGINGHVGDNNIQKN